MSAPATPDGSTEPDDPDSAPPPPARCDPATTPFLPPTLVANVNTAADDQTFSITGDELLAFGAGPDEMFSRTRADTSSAFGPPTGIDLIPDGFGFEHAPQITFDGLGLYFLMRDAENGGDFPMFVARADRSAAFDPDAVRNATVDNSAAWGAVEMTVSRDGATLYWQDFTTHRLMVASGDAGRFTARRFASTMTVANIVVSADELTLFYTDASGTLQVATRASSVEEFDAHAAVPSVDSPDVDFPVAITDDGCVLVLASARPGGFGGLDLWQAVQPAAKQPL